MKILFVISTLKAGGAERVMSVLSSYFAQTNDVSIVKFDDEKPFYELSPKIKIVNLHYGTDDMGIIGNIKKRFGKIFALRKLIKDGKFDIVISFIDNSNILTALANLGLKTPLIVSEHSHYSLLASKFWRLMRRLLYPTTSALTVLSKEDYEYYSFVKHRKIIHNPMYKIENIPLNKENIILFVGRLEWLKGCDRFLKIISAVDKNLIKNYEILIVGDGSERKNLEQLNTKLAIGAKFLGKLQDVSSVYAKSKIILSTSRIEGLSNVLIEAIYFECARVAIACSGPKELITDGVDGFLAQDEEESVKKLEQLLQDENLIENFIQNANTKKSEFSIENIALKWQNLINEIGVK